MLAARSLSDEVAEALPSLMLLHPDGPLARDIAERLSADIANVRRAMAALEDDGRAKIARRGRALHLLPVDHPSRICVICRAEFASGHPKTRTCSRSCARHLAWQSDDMRARHRASVKASHASPDVRAEKSARFKRLYADPAVRQRMSDNNRKSWADPEIRARRLASIDRAWQSETRRRKAADLKKKQWSDPEFRRKTIAAMRSGKRGEVARKIVELALTNPDSTHAEISAVVGCNVEAVSRVLRNARGRGEIGDRPGDGPRLRKKLFAGTPA